MSKLKNIIKYFGIFVVMLLLFRGILYRTLVNYSEVNIRNNISLTDINLINDINLRTQGKVLNIEEIYRLSNELTSENLSFTFAKISSNPNKVSKLKKANCIGYSSLFNAIGNYLIIEQNMTSTYEFRHVIGKLHVMGFNIHSIFDSSFFNDHDFNAVVNKKTDQIIYVDPSLRDYLRIDYVRSE